MKASTRLLAGIEASANLARLGKRHRPRLEKLGVIARETAVSSHLTLARFEPPGLSEKLRPAIQENAKRDLVPL